MGHDFGTALRHDRRGWRTLMYKEPLSAELRRRKSYLKQGYLSSKLRG